MDSCRRPTLAVLVFALAFALSTPASAQVSPRLSLEMRSALAGAAQAPGLAEWQRQVMIETAGGLAVRTHPPEGAAGGDDGTWTQLPPPSARYLHGAVYDPVRERMIVVGGYSTRDLVNDVWALSLTGTPRWTRLEPTGAAPTPRHLFSTIYDPVRDRIIVFGGLDRTVGFRDDLWALSLGGTPAWTRMVPDGPAPSSRAQHVAVFDPLRDRMIVFGGYHSGPRGVGARFLDEVWALSLGEAPAWTLLAPDGVAPAARTDASGAYDPVRDRMLVFGGWDGHALRNDTWSLSLRGALRWQEVQPKGARPEAREQQAAIFDANADRLVVFGGATENGRAIVASPETWALSFHGREEWTRIEAPGGPSGRVGPTAIFDPVRTRVIVYGGSPAQSIVSGEVWSLALGGVPAWTNFSEATPAPRRFASRVYDSTHHRFLELCGNLHDSHEDLTFEVWSLSTDPDPQWTLLHPKGSPPIPREGQSAIYDPVRDRVVVFGGNPDSLDSNSLQVLLNDVWVLSLAGDPEWLRLDPLGPAPVPRTDHTAIYDPHDDRMIVYGGFTPFAYRDDVWALSLSDPPTWTPISPAAPRPAARFEHSAIYDPVRRRMVIFGGFNLYEFVADAWALSLDGTPVWTRLDPSGVKPDRFAHSAIYDPIRDRMIISGGASNSDADPGGALSLGFDPPAWAVLGAGGTPPADGNGAIYDPTNDRMLLLGGDLWALEWGSSSEPRPAFARATRLAATSTRVDDLAPPSVAPNPAHGDVAISFSLAGRGEAGVRIYDLAGRVVRSFVGGSFSEGRHTIVWDGRTSAGEPARAGLYFCEILANQTTLTRRIVLAP